MQTECVTKLQGLVSRVLEMPETELATDRSLTEYDLDSMKVFEILGDLKAYYPDLPLTLLLEKQTLNEVAQYLCEEMPEQTKKFSESTGSLK